MGCYRCRARCWATTLGPGRPGGLAGGHVPAAGRCSSGHSTWSWCVAAAGPYSSTLGWEWSSRTCRGWGGWFQRLEAAGIDLASVTDVVLTHLHMDHCGGLLVDGVRERLHPDLRVHLAAAEAKFWEAPDFSRVSMPPGFPDALRRTGKRFLKEYQSQMRPFENEYEVAPGVLVTRTGGHTPGHSVVRLASGGDRLTFAGDAVFQVGFEHPDWYNGFEHDPEEAARVRVRLLRRVARVDTSRWWPLTCRSRPSAMWRSTATSFVGYRAPGSTDRLLGWA